ncbi:mRNA-decapping enzyme 1A-like protein [Dinothrombium tinctorium]|uniref:mRNA-decapping enzyme 1A-like protein n=1 Tax=Dinothrombium tinctorium TaxID=1965070 RepID=A0A3S3PCC7_9ACAR|nr:mRNA-decapping enzyme 1A-like protein [Dinothrombium tinctorium]RWS05659.1 mRNA-decapping enzyme 1A-like protein [Dinothrombium tinctorium]RWS05765.1 mRNA-decapping enzyme 1A-like protein [Dinothrombium tinctorium]
MNSLDDSESDINLRTLKRVDGSIVAIEGSATQVAVYKFSSSINEWERKEIEGSLFVVKRSTIPSYSLVVINRLNTTNMIEAINEKLDLKLEPPYLLYKNDKSHIYCIWFYDRSECTLIGERIQNLVSLSINDNRNVESKLARLGITQIISTNRSNNSSKKSHNNDMSEKGNDIISILQKGYNNSSNAKQATEAHSINCLSFSETLSNGANESVTNVNASVIQHSGQKSVDIQDLFATASIVQASKPNPLLLPNHVTKTPHDSGSHNIDQNKTNQSISLDDVLTPELLAKQKPKTVEINNTNPVVNLNTPQRSPPIIVSQQPTALFRPTPTNMSASAQHNLPLTMEQLKQSLIYLLQNDADFLHVIHSTYLNAFHKH